MLRINAISHVAIRTSDLVRSLEFYMNVLGMQEMFRLERDGGVWLVYLRVSDEQFLEIFPDGIYTDRTDQSIGYRHLCLSVDSISEAEEFMSAKGITLVRPRVVGVDGNAWFQIEDPDKNRIEIMEMSKHSYQSLAIERLKR